MRMLAATLVAAALAFPPAGAVADQPPTGPPCGFAVAHVPAVAPDMWTGYLAGGPVAAAGSTVTLACELRVNGDAVVSASSAPGAVAVVEPRVVSYGAADWEPVELCSRATVGGTTWSWDSIRWVAGSHRCEPLGTYPRGLLDCLVWWGLQCILPGEHVMCRPELAPGVPGVVEIDEQGDVYVLGEPFWDCPPYQEWS